MFEELNIKQWLEMLYPIAMIVCIVIAKSMVGRKRYALYSLAHVGGLSIWGVGFVKIVENSATSYFYTSMSLNQFGVMFSFFLGLTLLSSVALIHSIWLLLTFRGPEPKMLPATNENY